MATFLLVHGAFSGAWRYREVAHRLRAMGHEVHAPDLSGLGARAHLATPMISLSTHIQDVIGLIDGEGLEDVILCGHSYAGFVVTGVAAERAERIRSLVYIDAFVPEDGQSWFDIAGEEGRASYLDLQRDTPGLVAPSHGGGAGRLTPQPLLTMVEPVRTGGRDRAVVRRTYILATGEGATIFTQFHDRARSEEAWRTHRLPTGHIVMEDDPDGVVGILLAELER